MSTLDDIKRNFPRKRSSQYLEHTLKPALSSVDCFNRSFLTRRNTQSLDHGIDMEKVFAFFKFLKDKCARDTDSQTLSIVREALENLISNLPEECGHYEALRVYLIIPACHLMEDVTWHSDIIGPFAQSLMSLDEYSLEIIDGWLRNLSLKYFKNYVKVFTRIVGQLLLKMNNPRGYEEAVPSSLQSCIELMEKLNKVNECRSDKLPHQLFYVPALMTNVNIKEDYVSSLKRHSWHQTEKFHFCRYPFMFNTESKSLLLKCHNLEIMKETRERFWPGLSNLFDFLSLFAIIFAFYHYNWTFGNSAFLYLFFVICGFIGVVGISSLNSCYRLQDRYVFLLTPALFGSISLLLLFRLFDCKNLFIFIAGLAIIACLLAGLLYLLKLGNFLHMFHLVHYHFRFHQLLKFSISGLICAFGIVDFYDLLVYRLENFFSILFAFIAVLGIYLLYVFQSVFRPLHLMLAVNRESIIEDTRTQLKLLHNVHANFHKKNFNIWFIGENDIGPGVDQDFFTLLFQKLLKPEFGLFNVDEESGLMWIQPQEQDDLELFHFVGYMLGLAIYNSHLIGLPFPLALYKKLLDRPMDFDDLQELKPVVAKNLKHILDMEGTEVLDLTFEVNCQRNGGLIDVELCQSGNEKKVTDDNKQEYVDFMVDFYLNKNVEKELQKLYSGFHDSFDASILRKLKCHPAELRSLIVGKEKIDFIKLEKNVTYAGGYHKNFLTIRLLWNIIHALSFEDGKRFLRFLTGSERIPHTGLHITIRPLEIDAEQTSDLMPFAVTCSKELYLPNITDKERLRNRLFAAIKSNLSFAYLSEAYLVH